MNIINKDTEKQKSLKIMIYDYCVYAYLNIVSSVKQGDLGDFLKARSVFFKCQKYVKKGFMEMGKQLYLEPLNITYMIAM